MRKTYIEVLMGWGRKVFREPHQWLAVSLMFTLLALPVVTFGAAAASAVWLARQYSLEYRVRPFREVKHIMRPCFRKSLVMGLLDICFAGALAAMVFHMVANGALMWGYAFFAVLDLLFLLSGYYRYPVLVCNTNLSLWDVLVTGLMLAANNLGLLLMLFSVNALAAIISVWSGFGILLVYPGVTAFLVIYLYQCNLEKYRLPESGGNGK
ncbi:MAG: hypothetical protein FWH01_09060 [Oscillospiraceae bacterium]|nr:hypothetical protein [Oscillospiraceae bacterium]